MSDDFLAGSAAGTTVGTYPVEGVNVAFDSGDSDKYIYVYADGNDSRKLKGYVGTISGSGGSTSISVGTTQVIITGRSYVKGLAADPNNAGKFFLAYSDEDDSYKGKCVIVTLSGTTLTAGTAVEYDDALIATNDDSQVCADPNVENQFLIVYRESGSSATGKARVATVSGTSITLGTAATFESSTNGIEYPKVFASPKDSGKFVVLYRDDDNSFYGTAQTLSVSGTTITTNTAVVFQSANPGISFCGAFNPDVSGEFLVFFGGYLSGVYANRQWQGVVGTLNTSTNALTFTSAVGAGNNGENAGNGAICAVGGQTNKFLMSYDITNTGSAQYLLQSIATISSGAVTFGTRNTTISNETYGNGLITVANDPNNFGRCVTGYADNATTPKERSFITEVGGSYVSSNLTATNFIGIADAAISDTASGNITIKGGIAANGLSSLTPGSVYYVQTDGTFSTTADDPSVEAGKALSATSINLEYSS